MKRAFRVLKQQRHAQQGYAFVIVLILMLVGSLVITPLLSYMGTGLVTARQYESKSDELYAADAGIENGQWRIKYDHLEGYGPYEYSTNYTDPDMPAVNGLPVDVTIRNVWIPVDPANPNNLSAPSDPNDSQRIIAGIPDHDPPLPPRLVVTTSLSGANTIDVKLQYYYDAATPAESLRISQIGVWLSAGFHYNAISNLSSYTSAAPQIVAHAGGEAIVWSFSPSYPFAGDPAAVPPRPPFPGETGTSPLNPAEAAPLVSVLTFGFTGPPDAAPTTVAWVDTNLDLTQGGSQAIHYVWSADTRVYHIRSISGDTHVDAYVAKNALRELSLAKPGDYYATGNTLMIDSNHDSYGIRDTWVHTDTSIPDNSSSNNVPAESSPGSGDGVAIDGEVESAYLYWTSWFAAQYSTTTVFSDDCSNFATPPVDWQRSGDSGSQVRIPASDGPVFGSWNAPTYFAKVDETTPSDSDFITGVSTQSGSAYCTFNFNPPFSVPAGSAITGITIFFRARDATSGRNNIAAAIKVGGQVYSGDSVNPTSSFATYSYTFRTNPRTRGQWSANEINGIAANHLEQFGVSSTDLNPDVDVSMVYAQVEWDGTSRWTIYNNDEFQGQGASSASTEARTVTMAQPIDLSGCAPGTATLSWEQRASSQVDSTDHLYYALFDGHSWSANFEAFHGNSPRNTYSVTIPQQYLTSQFKLRFYFDFNATDEYVYVNNIRITQNAPPVDEQVYFKIDGHQVYFDSDGQPQIDLTTTRADHQIVADTSQWVSSIEGFSYACKKDVTPLVRAFAAQGSAGNHPGIAQYTVGGVGGTLGDNDPNRTQMSHAGWSLVIRYTSPTTKGHFVYLYDRFTTALDRDDIDFDGDSPSHHNGGTITGFIVPQRTQDAHGNPESIAARLTVFVGEGDDFILGDFLAFNAPEEYWDDTPDPSHIPDQYKLWDGVNSPPAHGNTSTHPNNVWNGMSTTFSADGIDIDTFQVPWDSNNDGRVDENDMLSPGDTSAHLDLYTSDDNWNLIYIIVSIRSVPTTGGALSYLIRQ